MLRASVCVRLFACLFVTKCFYPIFQLTKERGKDFPGADKHEEWGAGLRFHTKPWVRAR